MFKKIWLLTAFFTAFVAAHINAQKMNSIKKEYPFTAEWKAVEAFENEQKPQSAKQIVERIYNQATQSGQSVSQLKAQIWLLKYTQDQTEADPNDYFTKATQIIQSSKQPEKAIWQSIIAEQYWNYYTTNRWEILKRGITSDTPKDIAHWDAKKFFEIISKLYLASISEQQALQANIKDYSEIIQSGSNTDYLRSSLYDFLAYRAINFFRNEEKDLVQPAYKFIINDSAYFADASTFQSRTIQSKDSSSLHLKALQLYQSLLIYHQHDKNKEAYKDADLQRLKFIYTFSKLTNKKQRYKSALDKLYNEDKSSAVGALAKYQSVILELENPSTRKGATTNNKAIKNTPNVQKALYAIVKEHPNTEAAALSRNHLNELERAYLSLYAEQVVIPNAPSLIRMEYKNIQKVQLSLYKLKTAINEDQQMNWDDFKNLNAIKSWQEQVFKSEDMELHSTEIPIEGLPSGNYALIAHSDDKVTNQQQIGMVTFKVSQLSYFKLGNTIYVVDRKSGAPLADVQVKFLAQEYNSKSRKYEYKLDQVLHSDKNGAVLIPSAKKTSSNRIELSSKQDTFMNEDYFYHSEFQKTETSEERTYFFTDRSIYRPGQTIYYKGITIKSNANNGSVVPNQKSKIFFRDANYQNIATTELTTNEYGSITGSFIAPENILTGQMSIGNNTGTVYFSIEEYKRPNFEVLPDTISQTYTLNDKIEVTGKAQAFAGNMLDGATVKYRVERSIYFPYIWRCYWWGMPLSVDKMEITNGTTETDEQGRYKINFQALADAAIDPNSYPIYNYTVHIDITDVNGETQSAVQSIHAAYHALNISIETPEKLTALNELLINTNNLNGVFVPTNLQLSISKLNAPTEILRNRIWQAPDAPILSKEAFKSKFPNDIYSDENDPYKWAIQKNCYTTTLTTQKGKAIKIPQTDLNESGHYLITVETKDKNNKTITEKKIITIITTANKPLPGTAYSIHSDQQEVELGQKASIKFNNGINNGYWLQDIYGVDTSKWLNMKNNESKEWSTLTSEKDLGGIPMRWICIYYNRVILAEHTINVQDPSEQLELKWASHKDILEPGAKDQWSVTISGKGKEKVNAELLSVLYDASLDKLRAHNWNRPQVNRYRSNTRQLDYYRTFNNLSYGRNILSHNIFTSHDYIKVYPEFDHFISDKLGFGYGRGYHLDGMHVMRSSAPMSNESVTAYKKRKETEDIVYVEDLETNASEASPKPETSEATYIRKNLNETAFFLPNLHTNAQGEITINFTMPDALTKWNFKALAHTKDLATGYLEGSIQTQKKLMVQPNLPRFLRQGDEIEIAAKISNMTDKNLMGNARIELLDALTLQPVLLPFNITETEKKFQTNANGSTSVSWKLRVPLSFYNPITIRIIASTEQYSDGVEGTLSIMSNRTLVTETVPLWINGNGEKRFKLQGLNNADQSSSLAHHTLKIEYAPSPIWFVVQALPYLMESSVPSANDIFNRYYANAIAKNIIEQTPSIEKTFNLWKRADTNSLRSNLFKNEALKSATLQETPWVNDALSESAQKLQIATLFDNARIQKEADESIKKLGQLLLPEGAFPWFKGMRGSVYTTQSIGIGFEKLRKIGITSDAAQRISKKMTVYLDEQSQQRYEQIKKIKNVNMSAHHISTTDIHFLYFKSFSKEGIVSMKNNTAYQYFLNQSYQYWTAYSPYLQSMIALVANRNSNTKLAKNILASLEERAIYNEELGMYWKNIQNNGYWYESKIEAQSQIIESFQEINNDNATVQKLTQWLLKQKQTNRWNSSVATADACYAILSTAPKALSATTPKVQVQLGTQNYPLNQNGQKDIPGSVLEQKIPVKDIKPNSGDITLKVAQAETPSWGAVYWQYFENYNKIPSAGSDHFYLTKQLYKETASDRGNVLERLNSNQPVKVGDKIIIRLEFATDRDLEYVHIKDLRASCFEPVNVLSGYSWRSGLSYYANTLDLASNFYIDNLPKGKYVIEYPVIVNNNGTFVDGISSLQCLYAPEFNVHSAANTILVK